MGEDSRRCEVILDLPEGGQNSLAVFGHGGPRSFGVQQVAVETGGGTRTEFDGFSLLETTSEEPQTLRLEFLPIPGEIVVFGLVRASKYRIKLGVFRCLCY